MSGPDPRDQPGDDEVFGDVLPDTTADERDVEPGERERDDDERILRERPPHW